MAAVKRERIALLDEIRGFCILCMVFYHAFFLLGTRAGLAFPYALYRFFLPVQPLFASVFIVISGICTRFSRSALRRGILLSAIAASVSAVTVFLFPRIGLDGMQDKFGILHLLGCCMILAALFKKLPFSMHPVPGILVCVLLYGVSAFLLSGKVPLPQVLQNDFLCPLGLHSADFFSADYFPLFPHVFAFFAGVQIGKALLCQTLSAAAYRTHIRFFAFFGRHSLTVYLGHVPCLLILLNIMERI